jgi:hypothetical protein
VLDIDTTDERVLADAIYRHGATPIIIRTASGKFHLPYRFNGERRRIKPWRGLPIDLLGAGGLVVATPSEINGGHYEFVQGRLDDFDRLPILKGLEPASNGESLFVEGVRIVEASPLRGMREHDGRNDLYSWQSDLRHVKFLLPGGHLNNCSTSPYASMRKRPNP